MDDLTKYIGIPYKWRGTDYDGCDCHGLVVLVYRDLFGVELIDYKNLGTEKGHQTKAFLGNVEEEWVPISLQDAKPYDCMLLRNKTKRFPDHCGIILDRYRFLHNLEGVGSRIERISTWRDRIYRVYRHKALK